MKTKSKGRQHRACAMAAIGFALALLLANAQTTKAQWTTGTNINNTNSGNVGIGTTSPGSALEVSAAVPIIAITGSTSNAFRGLSLKDGNTEIGTLQSNGNSGELRQTA
ncbi:MAG TPA: hypothetical protein DC054_10270, partial [Blastocatellia bacterium]|nr:hypothetical protein [Blastocatellia bacterium]